MAAKSKTTHSGTDRGNAAIGRSALAAIRLLMLVALTISAYLAFGALTGDRVAGCGPDSGCDQVLGSKWAYWLNVPVSIFAIAVDSLMIGATFLLGSERNPKSQRTTWAWLVFSAILVFGAAAWFVGIQAFLLKTFCPYCMTAHACGALAAILVLVNAPIRSPQAKPWELEKLVFLAPRVFRRVAVMAVIALAVLVVGQVSFERRTLVLKPVALGTNSPALTTNAATAAPNPQTNAPPLATTPAPAPAPVPAAPDSNAPAAAGAKRLVTIYGGRFELDANELPTIGSPTNQHVVVSLFDYTCHHCRAMHPVLLDAQQKFSNQLAIISLPMPLDPTCNSTMQRSIPAHTNACAYAKLSLAVWRADRTKHHQFDDWIMTGEKPPALADAVLKAEQLVGENLMRNAMEDPWVNNQLALDVAIYELAYRAGRGQMPQLIVGPNVALGTYSEPELIKLLVENLGLQAAQ